MMKDILFIRADATPVIGTGHLMRCIALAQAWRDRGGRVIFISQCNNELLRECLDNEGFEVTRIDNLHPNPLDLKNTLNILKKYNFKNESAVNNNWLVIDGYNFDSGYHKSIRDHGHQLMVMDDYNHLKEYHADILINQNLGSAGFQYIHDSDTKTLLGQDYVLLRKEFLKYGIQNKRVPKRAGNILVTMGGADQLNITVSILEAFHYLNLSDLNIKVVVGPANPNMEALENVSFNSTLNIVLLQTLDMPRLMDWADLAISAGGSTVWELCYFGVPMILFAVADNQRDIVRSLELQNAARSIDMAAEKIPAKLSSLLKDLIKDQEQRAIMSKAAHDIVDGKGSKRILRQMVAGNITLQEAAQNDCKIFYKWASDPDVRRNSFSSDSISWEGHCKWFQQKLDEKNSCIFIILGRNDVPVGQIRFDIDFKSAEISYTVDPGFRGYGLGKEIIKLGISTVSNLLGSGIIFQGKVFKQNISSVRTFESLGFTKEVMKPESISGNNSLREFLIFKRQI